MSDRPVPACKCVMSGLIAQSSVRRGGRQTPLLDSSIMVNEYLTGERHDSTIPGLDGA